MCARLVAAIALAGMVVACSCGGSGGDPATATEPPDGVAAVLADVDLPTVEVAGEVRDTPVPYFGSRRDDGSPVVAADGFEPAPADAPFCAALAEINTRPQPSDDYEEVVVAREYFVAIEPLVPAEIGEPFDVVLTWVGKVADAGSFEAVDERLDGDSLLDAIREIDGFVDDHCLGR